MQRLPVNPLLKGAQVAHILNDCNVRILITTQDRLADLQDQLPGCPDLRTIVVLDDTSKSCTDSQESTSSPVVVVDAEEALKEDAPRAQQQTQQQETQRWEGTSSVGASSSVGPGEGDVESQWGRSMAQSSAYTGSISAITGVSGLEQSDTWSVGSMSIDLAEWS